MLLMVDKRILVVTGVLALGAAAVVLMDLSRTKQPDPRVGHSLLESTAAVDVDKIDLVQGETKLTLKRGTDNVWRIGDDQGFPVDAGKVATLVDDLARTTTQMAVSAGDTTKDSLAEFGLTTPARVTLMAKDHDVLALALGESRKSGGQYVGFDPGSGAASNPAMKAYLASQVVNVSADADHWELKKLFDIPKDQVKSVTFKPAAALAKKPAALLRAVATEPLKLQDLAEPQKEGEAVKSLDGTFANVTFTKRYDPTNQEAMSALAGASSAQIETFDGRMFEVYVGSVGDKTKKYFLRVKATVKGGSPTPDQMASITTLNDLMAKHAFEVQAFIAQRFEKGFSDFVEAPAGKG